MYKRVGRREGDEVGSGGEWAARGRLYLLLGLLEYQRNASHMHRPR